MSAPKSEPAELRIQLIEVDALRPNERNARRHPPFQVEQIAASIREFGFPNPILADLDDDGLIVAGHGRRLAVLKLVEGGEAVRLPNGKALPLGVVPVIDCSGWTEAQRRAYTLADNQLALTSEWDEELLKIELSDIQELSNVGEVGMTITDLGFTDADIGSLFGKDVDPDKEWGGMPEFVQQDKTSFRTIPVHFKDQEAVDKFAKAIGQKITEKTRFVWFPEIEIETYADKRYESDGT